MSEIVEKGENGEIVIPAGAAGSAEPHTRYAVVAEGNALRLVPLGESMAEVIGRLQEEARRLWADATPEERVQRFHEWAEQPRPAAPVLSDDSLRRENMYD